MMRDPLQKLRDLQAGKCAICTRERIPVVDHDHETGLVRGLLCTRCNNDEGKHDFPWIVAYRANPPALSLGLTVIYGSHHPGAIPNPGKLKGRHWELERMLARVAHEGMPLKPDDVSAEQWDEISRWMIGLGAMVRDCSTEKAEARSAIICADRADAGQVGGRTGAHRQRP
jgi:hypothetical protein